MTLSQYLHLLMLLFTLALLMALWRRDVDINARWQNVIEEARQ